MGVLPYAECNCSCAPGKLHARFDIRESCRAVFGRADEIEEKPWGKEPKVATIDSIKNILNENLDIEPDDVAPETTFESLEIDSLDMTELVCAVEEEFDIELENLEEIKTVGQLVDRIDSLR